MTYDLRQYQIAAIAETKTHLRDGRRRPLIVCPTGGGKTLIAVKGIIEPAVAKGSVVWFVAPRKQLVHQTSHKLDEIGMDNHGVVMASHWRHRPHAPVQVCSKDTLKNRHEKLPRPNIVIWDEAHHVTDANECGKIVEGTSAIHIGLTATPCRLDGKGLGAIFDCMIEVVTIQELIEQGFLIPPRVFADKSAGPNLSGVTIARGDYNQKQLGEATDQPKLVGNIVRQWIRDGEGRPTVCFAVNVKHSLHIVEQFRAEGVPAGHIDAHTPDDERQRLLGQLQRGEIRVMSSVGVFTEGFDMPCVGAVILARPTASLSLYLQMAGRGLRPEHGTALPGEHCIYLDHANLVSRFEGITKIRHWSLESGAEKATRPSIYKCRACGEVLRGRPAVCPHCGADLRTETDMIEIPQGTEVMLEEVKEDAFKGPSQEDRCAYYKALEEKGYTLQWPAAMVGSLFKKKFGAYPTKADRSGSEKRIKIIQNHEGRWMPVWTHEITEKTA